MTIESILTEWRYRLKKGYPDELADYDILENILIEDVGIDPIEAKQIANKAKSSITSNLLSEQLWRLKSPLDLIELFDELEQYAETQDIHKAIHIKNLVKDIKSWTDAERPAPLSVYEFIERYPELQTLLFHRDRATWNEFRNRITKAITDLRANNVATYVTSSTPIANTNLISNAIDFEKFILDKYSVKGQSIIGLPGMYDAIMKSEESADLLDLITTSSRVMELSTGVIPIRGVYGTLYTIIRNTIKIPNGDESELWFAIAFKGLVKGAVAGESGIEADIEVGNQTVSLKNYEKITFDFGSLSADGVQLLNGFLEMAKLLTGQDISKSKGREQINTVLDFLDNEKTEVDIRRIIQLGEESDIPMLQNISKKLQSFYKLDDNLDTMIHAFCNIVDKMVIEKITSVNWWGMIIKSNQTLFLESATELAPVLKCRNDRLSPAIANFHQNKLFVLGSQLNTKVTKKSQD